MEIGVTLIQNFAIALALGLLIGLEREYAKYQKRGHDYGGIRTYPLIALFGALSAFISDLYSPYVLLVAIFMISMLIIVAYFRMSEAERKFTGVTSEVAGFLTFFIGILSYYGEFTLAVVLAIVITILLYMRSFLHHFAKKIKKVYKNRSRYQK